MSLTIQRRDAYAAKQAKNAVSRAQIETDMETQKTISKNLNFATELANEAQRMREEEIAQLQAKHDALKEEISKLEGLEFTKEYFAELLA